MKNKILLATSSLIIVGAFLAAGTAFAQTSASATVGAQANTHAWTAGTHGTMMGMKPAVFGTVASVSGDTLTVTSKSFGKRPTTSSGGSSTAAPAPTPVTYTVNATNATVMKNNATSTIASVAVGDTVVVQGTISGTSVTATTIRDGVVPMMGPGGRMGMHATSTPPMIIPGNGQPVIGGTVGTVSGDTLTVATASGNVTYTVDATNAIVEKGNATSTVASIAAGDHVVVQGAVSGTSVSAYSVVDQGAPSTAKPQGLGGKVMGAIGGFFHHIFGFF